MSSDGYVSIYRQIWDNEYLWGDKPFARGQAWIDLVLLMNHKDTYVAKHKVTVHRGQRIISIRQLSDRWGWSRTKISDFLNSLQSAGMAKIESDTKKTVVTIANYSFFQDAKDTEKTPKRHRGDTEMPATNNNDNNDIKKIIYIVEYLNEKTGKAFKTNNKSTIGHINARLAEGFTIDDFKLVIDNRVNKWGDDLKMSEYLRPETLFSTKFEGYLNSARADKHTDDGDYRSWQL